MSNTYFAHKPSVVGGRKIDNEQNLFECVILSLTLRLGELKKFSYEFAAHGNQRSHWEKERGRDTEATAKRDRERNLAIK